MGEEERSALRVAHADISILTYEKEAPGVLHGLLEIDAGVCELEYAPGPPLKQSGIQDTHNTIGAYK